MTEKPVQILILEDEIGQITLAEEVFATAPFPNQVTFVRCLEEARSYLGETTPDLVISDVKLPDGSGLDILKERGSPPAFPVVFMTGYGDESAAVYAIKHGALDYVIKSGDTIMGLPRIAARAIREWNYLLDISKAEESLREAKQFNEEVIANASQGIVVYDKDLRYKVWNRFMEQRTGLKASEVLGKLALELFPYLRKQGVDIFLKRALNGAKVTSPDLPYIIPQTGKEGWVVRTYAPQRNAEGEIVGVIGIVSDITERVRLETEREALRRLSHELAGCLTLNDVGMTVARESRSMFNHDTFALYHVSEEEATIRNAYLEDTSEGLAEPVEMAPRQAFRLDDSGWDIHSPRLVNRSEPGHESASDSFVFVSPNSGSAISVPVIWRGTLIALLVAERSVPNRFSEENLRFFQTFADQCSIAVARIIQEQERRKLETQLLQSQKRESIAVLASGLAHDFNNLLTGMLGNIGLLLMDSHLAGEQRDLLEETKGGAQRAAELTRQMLDYAGKGQFVCRSINLSSFIEDLSPALHLLLSNATSLRFELAEVLPLIQSDPTQVRQIITNLVANAAESLEDKPGLITVRTTATRFSGDDLRAEHLQLTPGSGEYVCLEVSDNGCGMDDKVIARIFDPFFSTKFTGRGLGLASVLGIVRATGGSIKVESKPGLGSTFRVFFPVWGNTEDKSAEASPGVQDSASGPLILVADDDPMIQGLTVRILKMAGFSALAVGSLSEALELMNADSAPVSLILLDMSMPCLEGKEGLYLMRELRPDIPVVLVSGRDENDAKRCYPDVSYAAYVQKPYSPEALVDRIHYVLETGRRET